MVMTETEWKDFALTCKAAVIVRGGAMCHNTKRTEYCQFERCPRNK
jgi:hypothetical protein